MEKPNQENSIFQNLNILYNLQSEILLLLKDPGSVNPKSINHSLDNVGKKFPEANFRSTDLWETAFFSEMFWAVVCLEKPTIELLEKEIKSEPDPDVVHYKQLLLWSIKSRSKAVAKNLQ